MLFVLMTNCKTGSAVHGSAPRFFHDRLFLSAVAYMDLQPQIIEGGLLDEHLNNSAIFAAFSRD